MARRSPRRTRACANQPRNLSRVRCRVDVLPRTRGIQTVKIELHSKACSCRGGSWVLMGSASTSLCELHDRGRRRRRASEWRSLGKPASVEEYTDAHGEADDREGAARIQALCGSPARPSVPHRLVAQPRGPGRGLRNRGRGRRRCTRLLPNGAREGGHAHLRAPRVPHPIRGPLRLRGESEGTLRVGLRFLDAPFPEALIPADAQPASPDHGRRLATKARRRLKPNRTVTSAPPSG